MFFNPFDQVQEVDIGSDFFLSKICRYRLNFISTGLSPYTAKFSKRILFIRLQYLCVVSKHAEMLLAYWRRLRLNKSTQNSSLSPCTLNSCDRTENPQRPRSSTKNQANIRYNKQGIQVMIEKYTQKVLLKNTISRLAA